MPIRARLVGAALHYGLRAAAAAGKLRPDARLDRYGIEVDYDVPYGPARHERLDVYRPASATGRAALYLHGGGFRILSKDTHWMMAKMLARSGWTVFNADYRLAPQNPFPAAIEDACAALDWVIRNGARYGADPNELLLIGESAGGNLVTALALATTFERPEPWAKKVHAHGVVPRAVAPLCGILEVSNGERYLRDERLPPVVRARIQQVCRAYLGDEGDEERLFFADPLRVLESPLEPARPLPPFFASVGTGDPILDDTRRLHRALERRGVPHEVRYYSREIHAFQALYWTAQGRRSWEDLFAFLDAVSS
ncbi:MAG: alpha/beta hydrolase [Myxococcota bacterium]|nr:alpha/beta hydrolase [Myxococcota bacterium]